MEVINYLKRNNGSGHIVEHIGWHESGDYLLRQLFASTPNGYRQHKYEVEKEYNVIDKSEIDTLERQTCGRRINDLGPWERTENIDFWHNESKFKTCSFCGSLHPDNVLQMLKKDGFGVIERASGKNYKWYLGNHKYYLQHNTQEFCDEYNAMVGALKQS